MTAVDQVSRPTTRGSGLASCLAALDCSTASLNSLRSELPVAHEAAGTARAQLNRLFPDLTPAELFNAKLILTELVANAVAASRASDSIWMKVQLSDGELLLEVFDQSRRIPRRRIVDDRDEGGRGLLLVERLSTDWGWRPEADGKVVWAIARSDPA